MAALAGSQTTTRTPGLTLATLALHTALPPPLQQQLRRRRPQRQLRCVRRGSFRAHASLLLPQLLPLAGALVTAAAASLRTWTRM
jgi:hypothetical protein